MGDIASPFRKEVIIILNSLLFCHGKTLRLGGDYHGDMIAIQPGVLLVLKLP